MGILGDNQGMKSPLFPPRKQRGQPAEFCQSKPYTKQPKRVLSMAYAMLPDCLWLRENNHTE